MLLFDFAAGVGFFTEFPDTNSSETNSRKNDSTVKDSAPDKTEDSERAASDQSATQEQIKHDDDSALDEFDGVFFVEMVGAEFPNRFDLLFLGDLADFSGTYEETAQIAVGKNNAGGLPSFILRSTDGRYARLSPEWQIMGDFFGPCVGAFLGSLKFLLLF